VCEFKSTEGRRKPKGQVVAVCHRLRTVEVRTGRLFDQIRIFAVGMNGYVGCMAGNVVYRLPGAVVRVWCRARELFTMSPGKIGIARMFECRQNALHNLRT